MSIDFTGILQLLLYRYSSTSSLFVTGILQLVPFILPTFFVCSSRYDPLYGGAARAPPSTYTGSDYGTYNRAPSRGAFIPPPPLSGTYNRAPLGGIHPSAPSVRYVQPSTIGGIHPSAPSVRYAIVQATKP